MHDTTLEEVDTDTTPIYERNYQAHDMPLDEIVALPEYQQVRVDHLRHATVEQYREVLQSGGELPPIKLIWDGQRYYLADGFHTLEAHKLEGYHTIAAHVYEGNKRDVPVLGAWGNRSHGLAMSAPDRKRAIEMILNEPDHRAWSDRKVARIVGCHPRTVSRVRSDMEIRGIAMPQDRQVERAGATYTMRQPATPEPPTDLPFTPDPEYADECEIEAPDQPDVYPDEEDDEILAYAPGGNDTGNGQIQYPDEVAVARQRLNSAGSRNGSGSSRNSNQVRRESYGSPLGETDESVQVVFSWVYTDEYGELVSGETTMENLAELPTQVRDRIRSLL